MRCRSARSARSPTRCSRSAGSTAATCEAGREPGLAMSRGPLAGLRVLEFEAIGPGPFAGMMLADMGADVILVDRPLEPGLGVKRARRFDLMMRGRHSLTLDLKSEHGAE